MDKGRRIARGMAAAGMAGLVAVGTASAPATATDLEALRTRAQGLGDRVSALEGELASLTDKQTRLSEEIAQDSADIGVLESQMHDIDRIYGEALEEYIDRAVEAYKSGPTGDLALLLSAQTLDEVFTYTEVTAHIAREDARALDELVASKEAALATQDEIDEHKQRVLAKTAAVVAVTSEIETGIALRRGVLRELTAEIEQLEEQARAAAARSALPDQALLDLLQPSGPAPGIPDGFAGTGVTFEGIASWYGPGFEGNPTANGDIFDPDLFTAASKELPLGSWLYVEHEGRGVVVLVNDRGPYIDGRVLDLSRAAAEAIGIGGLGWIEAEILIKA